MDHIISDKDENPATTLWTDGLLCAFEFIRGHKKSISSNVHAESSSPRHDGSHWVPIGWARISELVQNLQMDADLTLHQFESMDDEAARPIWWCHVNPGHPSIQAWLSSAQWLHFDVKIPLKDESFKMKKEGKKHLLYEVPVRVAGGLLFELFGQSVGDPFVDEGDIHDIPIVLRSWQAQNFLITAMHIRGNVSITNVLGIKEVQELLSTGGYNTPRTVHEVIAHLAFRLSRWDDRLFRKNIFGAADEIELKFMSRRNQEDMDLFSRILNQEIRKLSSQVIRVKGLLHAREEIVIELLQHLRGNAARNLLGEIRTSTKEMIGEQEVVCGRLFTIQDMLQNTIRAWLQDKSLRVTHNLAVFGGCSLVLSTITGLFGINVDLIPGAKNKPYAFGLFAATLIFFGVLLIVVGFILG